MKRHVITALLASSAFAVAHANAALIVTYISETRSVHSEGSQSAYSLGDFSPWTGNVSGSYIPNYPEPYPYASSSAWQHSHIGPNFIRMFGSLSGDTLGDTAVATSRLFVEFTLSEASWMHFERDSSEGGAAFANASSHVLLTGPFGSVNLGTSSGFPGMPAIDFRQWPAGSYQLDVALDYSFGAPGGLEYDVVLWIPTPGTAALSLAGLIFGFRRRRMPVTAS
jgi:hypothetical protein